MRLHMISPDGEQVYHCRPEEEACELAYTRAEFHQWIFNGPPGWTADAGTADGDLTRYTYSAKKLWTIEGASQEFYLEDLEIYADDTRIVRTIARTTSHTPESEDDIEVDETLDDEDDDSTFIAEEEEGEDDVTDIIGDVSDDEES